MSPEIKNKRQGVELRKHYTESEYNLPSVVYELTSDRREPVSVRIVEELDETLDPSNIGFRKEESKKNWTVRGMELILDCELPPESTCEKVFALRPESTYDPEELVTDPDKFEVTPKDPLTVNSKRSGSFKRSASTTEENRNGAIDHAEDSTEPGDTDSSPIDEISLGPDSDGPVARESHDKQPDESETLIDRLVAELEAEAGSKESREYLRENFAAKSRSNSVDARIRQLQSDLADLRAYTNALETFLDDRGSANEIIGEFEDRIDSFEDELSSLESNVDNHEELISNVQNRSDGIEERLESTSSDLDSLTGTVEELRTDLSSIDDRVPEYDVGDRIDEIENELTDVSGFIADLKGVLGSDNASTEDTFPSEQHDVTEDGSDTADAE